MEAKKASAYKREHNSSFCSSPAVPKDHHGTAAGKIYYLHDAWAKNNRHRSSRSPRGGHLLAAAAGFITVTTHTEAQTHKRACTRIVPTSNTLATQKQNSGAARHKRHYFVFDNKIQNVYKELSKRQKWPGSPARPARQRLFFTSLISLDKQAEWQIQKDEESKRPRWLIATPIGSLCKLHTLTVTFSNGRAHMRLVSSCVLLVFSVQHQRLFCFSSDCVNKYRLLMRV